MLETTLIILLTVLLVNLIFRVVNIPVILGYLIAGTALGPNALALVMDTETIRYLAELGVALLMFTIGLEFSLSKLVSLRFPVFVLGGLQVLGSVLVTVLIGRLFHMTLIQSLVTGCVVAMSSTALVVKQLSEQHEVHTRHGLNAVGILLFQDLAVVPILIVIASLGEIDGHSLWQTLSFALGRGVLAILLILALGRWLLQPLFRVIKSINAAELFTLTVLFVAFGSAWITEKLGLTYALGAFLSGIMLSETEYRPQIQTEIRPFRDVLLGLFFVSVGMLSNLATWSDTWMWIALTLFALVVGKLILIASLSLLFRYEKATAFRTALIVSEGGEFGFAILALALIYHLLPADYGQVILAALLISYAIAPWLIRYNKQITDWLKL